MGEGAGVGRKSVAVLGSGAEPHEALATPLGRLLARLDVNLVTGGGAGVMEAVSRAFVEASPGGACVGVLPCRDDDPTRPPEGYPNRWVQVAVRTHLPDRGREGALATSRNHINVLSADAIVALPGAHGTLSELQLAAKYRKPTVIFCEDAAQVGHFPAEIARVTSIDEVARFLRATLDVPA